VPCLVATGGSGFVGGQVAAAALAAGWRVVNADLDEAPLQRLEFLRLEITDAGAVSRAIVNARPDAIIHCAALADIDQAEHNPDLAWRVNVTGTENIARAAAESGARLIALSTSTIFDGERGAYTESDPPNPINVYGRTKVAAEQAVAASGARALVARISMAYGYPRTGGASFLTRVIEKLRRGEKTQQPSDEFRTPLDVLTAADTLLELAAADIFGVLHLGGAERISRYHFALKIARRLGADPALVEDTAGREVPGRAPRPKDVSFRTDRGRALLRTPVLDVDAGLARVMGE
jgi:dTDP-4-dehydrorhamnose reductase